MTTEKNASKPWWLADGFIEVTDRSSGATGHVSQVLSTPERVHIVWDQTSYSAATVDAELEHAEPT